MDIESEDKEETIPDMGKCRFCSKMFSKYGIKKHETACMRVEAEKQTSNDDDEITELENEEEEDVGIAVYYTHLKLPTKSEREIS